MRSSLRAVRATRFPTSLRDVAPIAAWVHLLQSFGAVMNRSDEEIAQKVSQKDLGEAVSDLLGILGLDFVFEALTAFFRKLWYDPSERARFETDRATQG